MKTFFCQGAWFSSRRGASVHAFHKRCAVAVSVWLAVLMACAGASPQPSGTMHADGRGTTKLMFPTADGGAAAKGPQTADAFLKAHHGTFKVAEDLSNLELVTVRESLLGQHYRYRQVLNGVPVDGADLVVSIRRTSGQVYQAYNNTYPVQEKPVLSKTRVGAEAALDAAWQHLRVHGTLLSPLRAKLVYIPNQGGVFRLVYKTLVAVTAPFGYWEHQIDAVSGEVLSVRDTVIRRKGNPKTLPDFSAYTGEVWPRAKAVSEYELIALKRSQTVSNVSKTAVNGTAYVFEGDPRTYLADAALTNASVPEAFVAAYVQRPLQEISLSDGTYALAGPWVTIVDFEAPNTVPSTTTTGHWTSSRGNNAFNDVMTYYHIDQNQRYLQSLGYVGDTGIQYASIQADSDGVAGDDNSYYDPNGNRLSFGHGGVDDNEDADVILHEYGHAITYDIIPSWGGGDTGAIGEGFGDYWGASYSNTTTNGTTFHPEWAFSWDGHSADTWSGRFLNMTNLTYDAAHTYLDHESINGIDNYSDQLWGTPLVQAFQTLRERGCPREEIDKIMIESFFGIGSGPNLRDMANATVKAAMELFPDGPHASVFYEKFLNQLIVGLAPILTYPTGGGERVLRPGLSCASSGIAITRLFTRMRRSNTRPSCRAPRPIFLIRWNLARMVGWRQKRHRALRGSSRTSTVIALRGAGSQMMTR